MTSRIDRRSFLKIVALASGAAAIPPQSGAKVIVLGAGLTVSQRHGI